MSELDKARKLCRHVASDIRFAIRKDAHLDPKYAAGHKHILEVCAQRLEEEYRKSIEVAEFNTTQVAVAMVAMAEASGYVACAECEFWYDPKVGREQIQREDIRCGTCGGFKVP